MSASAADSSNGCGSVVARAEAGVKWTNAFAGLPPSEFPMLFALTA